jgi:hypothetical protein
VHLGFGSRQQLLLAVIGFWQCVAGRVGHCPKQGARCRRIQLNGGIHHVELSLGILQCALCQLQVGVGGVALCLQQGVVQPEERIAGFDIAAFLDEDLNHFAGTFSGHVSGFTFDGAGKRGGRGGFLAERADTKESTNDDGNDQ